MIFGILIFNPDEFRCRCLDRLDMVWSGIGMGIVHPYGIKAESLYRSDGNSWMYVHLVCAGACMRVYAGGLMAGLIFLKNFLKLFAFLVCRARLFVLPENDGKNPNHILHVQGDTP